MSRRGRLRVSAAVLSFGGVIGASTGCSKVRSPDSFTKQNVFDFTYPTNIFFRVKPYIKDLFCSTVLSETRDYMIRLSETELEKKNVKLNNMCMFYNIY